ncbi:uncharacterized protein [Haliotis cracherodii]|uniref:uncharacterized protein n=1 Tax=Haliotis cracherodii TaxID=6455 RepID=UPI0039E87ED1
MASHLIVAVFAVLAVVSHHANAQWWGGMGQQAQVGGWGQPASAAVGMRGMIPEDPTLYQTCVGKNSNGDEMRVTLSLGSSNGNRFQSSWNSQFGGPRNLRLSAVVSASTSSTLQGQFQFVVTEGSRVEEGCSSRALGDILTDRFWWSQSRNPRGIVGTPVTIFQGQTATSSETIDSMTFEELTGRGLALCPSRQISGSTCMDVIPLCCKIGFDSQSATTPFATQSQFGLGMGSFGMQNPNMAGGMNQALPGMNQALPGMNQALPGMNQGLPGMNQGLPGMNQGLPGMNQGLPGMNQGLPGMNQGLPGMNQGGTSGNQGMAGLAF